MSIAVVAGGAGGIGQALVDALIRDGYSVAIWDINEEQINKIISRYNTAKVLGVKCDIVNYEDVLHALKLTHERLGKPIKVLVNAAGLFHVSGFLEIDANTFKRIIEVDLIGAANTIRAVLPGMIDSGGGTIINIVSIWGSKIGPNRSAYIASKWGLLALTKALSEEFKNKGIRFIAISPGPVATPMTLPYVKGEPPKDWLRPEDVAKVIMFIIKEDSFGGGEEIQIFGKGTPIGIRT
jgi:3-oxoacyl-[acyl-carrier protein] reductase